MPTEHDPACGLCKTNHPLMTYRCAAEYLGLRSWQTVAQKEAGTGHLKRMKLGGSVRLYRRQVEQHLINGFRFGKCEAKDGRPAPCERVFDDEQEVKSTGRLRDWE